MMNFTQVKILINFEGNRVSSVEKYMKKSLSDLQLDYVDIYLVHAPFGLQEENETFKKNPQGGFVLDLKTNIIEVWKVCILCEN